MKRAIFLITGIALTLAIAPVGFSQEKSTIKILNQRKTIRLEIDSTKPLPRAFVASTASQAATYRLFEIESPDPHKMCTYNKCINELTDFLDRAPQCDSGIDCQRINLHLKSPLATAGSYLLLVTDFGGSGTPGKFPFKGAVEAEITGPFNADSLGRNFRVKANADIQSANQVNVERLVVKVAPDSMNVVEVSKVVPATLLKQQFGKPTALEFRLAEKLQEGREYTLSIPNGIVDSGGQTVAAKGKLKIPGLPAKPDDPKISISLTSLSAVHQKSVFDLTANYSPLRNPNTGSWYWEPNLVVDVGLRSTKSNNSIVLAVPVTRFFAGKIAEIVGLADSNIPLYAGWKRTPWTRLGSTKLFLGPKVEFDRKFQRVNVLGSMRLEFNFYRWLGSIKYKRDLIARREPPFGIGKEKADALEGLDSGFKIVPYLSFDFGGHVNNETVTKTVNQVDLSVAVPRHPIFRSYAGVVSTIEWRTLWFPTTLTVDESIVYMATKEKIGYSTDDGVFLRQLHGFHPRSKVTLDLAFDPAKHYSFTVTFENGRLAPNFEYLNKLTSGFKVQY